MSTSPFESPDYCHEGRPIPNSTPPSPFELASLATAFLAAGKTMDEAFVLARDVFRRSEIELESGFPTLEEVRQVEMMECMPNLDEELRGKFQPWIQRLRIKIPDEADFPLSFPSFFNKVLPQVSEEDRRKWFESRVLPVVSRYSQTPPVEIPDLSSWLQLLEAAGDARNWEDQGKLQRDARALESPSRRVAKKWKGGRQRKRTTKKNHQYP
jgi:hypothetical protein